VNVHDFEAKKLGNIVPYRVYDVTANTGEVAHPRVSRAPACISTLRGWGFLCPAARPQHRPMSFVPTKKHPYDASGGGIQTGFFPTWVLEGGRDAELKRLKDGVQRAKIKNEVARIIRRRGGQDYLDRIVISRCPWDEQLAGKTLADVARLRGKNAGPEDGAEEASA
jgi:hypothetical protein